MVFPLLFISHIMGYMDFPLYKILSGLFLLIISYCLDMSSLFICQDSMLRLTNENSFQISTVPGGTAVTILDTGSGNAHEFEMFNKNSKTIITIDDLIQQPVTYTGTSHILSDSIGSASTIFTLSGISSISPEDILKIEDEYIKVVNVGLGTTSIGPITNNGTFNLVLVDRGFVGTSQTDHTASTQVDIYRGSYNITGKEIHLLPREECLPQKNATLHLAW